MVQRADRAQAEAEHSEAVRQFERGGPDGFDGLVGGEPDRERATRRLLDLADEVGPQHAVLVAVEARAERVAGAGADGQLRAGLADTRGRLPLLVQEAGVEQFGHDLGHGLLGEAGAFGELDPAEATGSQDVREQEGAVVLAHVAQVPPGGRHGLDLRTPGQFRNTVV